MATDLAPLYDALRNADAAGDTAGAQRLAAYIRSASRPVKSYDSVNGQLVPTGSPAAIAARSPLANVAPSNFPVTDEITGFGRNALLGSGKFFTDVGLGAEQLVGAASRQDAADKRSLDAPLMATAGGRFGQLATGALSAVPLSAIPGAGTYLGAGAIGAGYGALTPVTPNDSRILNTAVGAGLGVGGQAVGNVLSRWLANRAAAPYSSAGANANATIAPSTASAQANASGNITATGSGGGYTFGTVGDDASAGLTAAQAQAAEVGQSLGMRMTPGQQTGSRALQQLEAKLESQPMTSGPFNTIKTANQQAVNRAWAGAIGESGNAVDSATLSNASDRLGQIFENVRSPNNIVVTNPQATAHALDSIDQDVRGLLPGNASIRDNPLVQDVEALTAEGGINGQQLGSLSSKLGRAAAKQMTTPGGDRDWGQALYAVKNHVDDMIQSSLSGDEAVAYGQARQQYRALMQLTARTGNVNPSTGNVSGQSMANYLQQTDKRGFLFGNNQSDAYNAVRFAQAFKPIVGDSGTATRMPLPGITDFLVGGAMNLGTRAYLNSGGAGVAAAANAASATARGVGSVGSAIGSVPGVQQALPYAQAGLPGFGGTLVPYLTQ